MARPIPDLDEMFAAEVAADDDLIIDDFSASETKRIKVGELLGLPKMGWTASGESWSFSSWTAATRIGVITVPSDATLKYTPGMRIEITQVTGGIKHALIHAVSATTLTLFFESGATLVNQAISSIYYSSLKVPFGFKISPLNWRIRKIYPGGEDKTSGLSNYQSLSSSLLTLGKGSWKVKAAFTIEWKWSGTTADGNLALSDSSTTASIDSAEARVRMTSGGGAADHYFYTFEENVDLTSDKSFRVIGKGSTMTEIDLRQNSIIEAVSSYL